MGKGNLGKDGHLVPHGDDWAVKRPEASRASSVHPTQEEAIEEVAIPGAKRDRGEVVIHRPDGRIRDKDSYGNDPHLQ